MFTNAKIKTRLIALVLVPLIGLICIGAANLYAIVLANKALQTAYEDRLVPVTLLNEMMVKDRVLRLKFTEMVNAQSPEITARNTQMLSEAYKTSLATWKKYRMTNMGPEEKSVGDQLDVLREKWVLESYTPGLAALAQGDYKTAAQIDKDKNSPLITKILALAGTLIEMQVVGAKEEVEASASLSGKTKWGLGVGLVLIFLILATIGFTTLKEINYALFKIQKVLQEFGDGDFSSEIKVKNSNELGKLFESLKGTQHKLLETNAQAADFRNQVAAMSRAQAVIYFKPDGEIISINENFTKAMGYLPSDVVGFHHSMLVKPEFRASPEYVALWDKLRRGEAASGEFLRINKSGKEIWLSATYNPILDADGKVCKVVKQGADISDQIRARRTLELTVEQATAAVAAAKDGDLTQRVPLEGKSGAIVALCEGMNTLIESMSAMVGHIKSSTGEINNAAKEIASGNADLSRRTEQQASNLEETASSMEELTSTVKQNADNARQANQLAISASEVAVKGGTVVGEVVATMDEINSSSKKIADIISVIDGIAFQTNILALNAAVEAARAGEQGRGFAVVASEVRNLAQRSAAAAKEIKALIEDSVGKVELGTKLVDQAGETMTEVVTSIRKVSDIVAEIAEASVEQSMGIEQVNDAVTQMDEVTQQNAALVEEASAAAQSLSDQADSLEETVARFRIEVQQAAASSGAAMIERRGPDRARNVTRPAFKSAAASKPASRAPAKAAQKTGTDNGDWEEF